MKKTHSLGEFQQAAEEFARTLTPLPGRATVVGLYGELGAGKTTFAQAVGRALGIRERMQSPTFVILKRFIIHNSYFKILFHIDAYRLKNGEELRRLGFEELLHDPGNLILVEWADRVADILPPDHLKMKFTFIDENTRAIIMNG